MLSVSDLDASTAFDRDVLGLELVSILPAQDNFKEMRFFRAPGPSANHHNIAIIANATLPLAAWGQPSAPGLFHVAFEVGTISELEDIGNRQRGRSLDRLSVYARDPDDIPLEIVWRVPNADWTYDELCRRQLDLDAAKQRWGAGLATGSAAGEAA